MCSEGTPKRVGRGRCPRHAAMRRSFRTRVCFSGWSLRVVTLGWYAMPLEGMGLEPRCSSGSHGASGVWPFDLEMAPRSCANAMGHDALGCHMASRWGWGSGQCLRRVRSFLFKFTVRARFFLGLLGVAGFLGFRHRRVLARGPVRPLVFLWVRRLGVGCQWR